MFNRFRFNTGSNWLFKPNEPWLFSDAILNFRLSLLLFLLFRISLAVLNLLKIACS